VLAIVTRFQGFLNSQFEANIQQAFWRPNPKSMRTLLQCYVFLMNYSRYSVQKAEDNGIKYLGF